MQQEAAQHQILVSGDGGCRLLLLAVYAAGGKVDSPMLASLQFAASFQIVGRSGGLPIFGLLGLEGCDTNNGLDGIQEPSAALACAGTDQCRAERQVHTVAVLDGVHNEPMVDSC